MSWAAKGSEPSGKSGRPCPFDSGASTAYPNEASSMSFSSGTFGARAFMIASWSLNDFGPTSTA